MAYTHNQYTYVILLFSVPVSLFLSVFVSLSPSLPLSLSFFTPVAPGPALFIMWMTRNMNQFSFFLRWKMRGPDGIKFKKKRLEIKKERNGWMEEGKDLRKEGWSRGPYNLVFFFFLPLYRLLFFTLTHMLSQRAHGSVGLRSWIFYAITLCIRVFHMTSIVVSLYFKQENCETLISLYN